MNSVKCHNCGLVNFATIPNCKRCQAVINAAASNSQPYQDFNSPPPPPVFGQDHSFGAQDTRAAQAAPCIKCGKRDLISIRNFVKVYNSPVALVGIFLGLIPYIILKLLLQTKHNLTGPFCETCWTRFEKTTVYGVLNALLLPVLWVAGIVFSIAADSEWLLLASVLLPIFVFAVGRFYINGLGPKYKRVNSKEVVIDAPLVGDIVYTK